MLATLSVVRKMAKILKLGETESVTELLLSFFQQHFSDEITTLEHCIKSKHFEILDLQETIRNKDIEIEMLKQDRSQRLEKFQELELQQERARTSYRSGAGTRGGLNLAPHYQLLRGSSVAPAHKHAPCMVGEDWAAMPTQRWREGGKT